MNDTFDVLAFNRAERLKQDELHVRVPPRQERGEYGFQSTTHFPEFEAITQQTDLGGPLTKGLLKGGNNEYDILEGLPQGYMVFSLPGFTGRHNRQQRRVDMPIIHSKGNLLSGMHELAHAKRQSAASQEYITALDEALDAKHSGILTPKQKDIILLEEENAWEMAQQDLKRAQDKLGVALITDEHALQDYVTTRLNIYKEHL